VRRAGLSAIAEPLVILFSFFSYFFVSMPCAKLSWPFRQILSSRINILYRIVSYGANANKDVWPATNAVSSIAVTSLSGRDGYSSSKNDVTVVELATWQNGAELSVLSLLAS